MALAVMTVMALALAWYVRILIHWTKSCTRKSGADRLVIGDGLRGVCLTSQPRLGDRPNMIAKIGNGW